MSARLRRQYAAYCKAYGDAARERGAANEGRLLATVLSLRAGASWILDARAATPDEDRRGIDVVVISDVGGRVIKPGPSFQGLDARTGKERACGGGHKRATARPPTFAGVGATPQRRRTMVHESTGRASVRAGAP